MTETEEIDYSVRSYLLYKLDRTIAIVGIVALGAWALSIGTTESIQIAVAAVGFLGGYVGGRTGK